MARGINKVILVGNLGADPETRYMPSGGAVTNVRLATADSWRDKQSGEQRERTEWHRVVFFNRLAEIAAEYLRKGSQVYVEGRIQTRKWQGQDGQDRYTTEIVANEMQMLGGRGGGGSGPAQGEGDPGWEPEPPGFSEPSSSAPAPAPAPAARSASSANETSGRAGSNNNDEFDDDIPVLNAPYPGSRVACWRQILARASRRWRQRPVTVECSASVEPIWTLVHWVHSPRSGTTSVFCQHGRASTRVIQARIPG